VRVERAIAVDRRGEPARRWLAVLSLATVLAFAVQGSRGLWEPDEGFYANVAQGMAASGDWWIPRLNGEPFLDKPPLNYWSMAAGLELFGHDEWALRSGHALSLVATAILVGLLAGRLWGRRSGPLAVAVYALMLAPFVAANVLTPDTLLTFWVSAAFYLYWRARADLGAGRRAGRWIVLLGLAAGGGFLAKGPAMLIFLLPIGAHALVAGGWRDWLRPASAVAALLAIALGGGWYLLIVERLPGAAAYVFDNQVAGRLWSAHYRRNGDLLGSFRVYLPMLLVGGLPWSLVWPSWLWRARRRLRNDDWWRGLRHRPAALLIACWILLPLVVLAVARSRLPLYALPVMPALALATTRLLNRAAGATDRLRQGHRLLAAGWVVSLLALKVAASTWPTDDDARRLAAALSDLDVGPASVVVAVDVKCNGLAFYGYRQLHWVRRWSRPYPFYSPPRTLGEELRDLRPAAGRPVAFVVHRDHLAELERELPFGGGCEAYPAGDGLAILRCHGSARTATMAAGRQLDPAGGRRLRP